MFLFLEKLENLALSGVLFFLFLRHFLPEAIGLPETTGFSGLYILSRKRITHKNTFYQEFV